MCGKAIVAWSIRCIDCILILIVANWDNQNEVRAKNLIKKVIEIGHEIWPAWAFVLMIPACHFQVCNAIIRVDPVSRHQ